MPEEVEIEAFIAGVPAARGITASQAAEAVQGFDPSRMAVPIVMGHPGDDQAAPAFGEISGARMDGDKMLVRIKNLAQEAIDGVRNSRIVNRSLAFWHPAHPSNPTPGKLGLRHLGLLGASAPAIPGMARLAFSDDAGLSSLGEPDSPVIFAAHGNIDPATVTQIAQQVADILNPKQKEFSVTEAEIKAEQDRLAKEREQVAADQAELLKKQNQFNADQAAFETERKALADKAEADRKAGNVTFAAQLVQDGKMPKQFEADIAALLNALPTDALQFSADQPEAPDAAMRRVLAAMVPVVQFSTFTPSGPGPAKNGPDDAAALAAANAKMANAWQGNKS